jgi:hypothetical protein
VSEYTDLDVQKHQLLSKSSNYFLALQEMEIHVSVSVGQSARLLLDRAQGFHDLNKMQSDNFIQRPQTLILLE